MMAVAVTALLAVTVLLAVTAMLAGQRHVG
jgi:hypothetical protein